METVRWRVEESGWRMITALPSDNIIYADTFVLGNYVLFLRSLNPNFLLHTPLAKGQHSHSRTGKQENKVEFTIKYTMLLYMHLNMHIISKDM